MEAHETHANRELKSALGNIDAELTVEQKDVIRTIMSNNGDHELCVIYIDRTGAGKSASYFISTKLLRASNKDFGPTIIITPLNSLANDQVKSGEKFGLVLKTYNSTLNQVEKGNIIELITKNKLDILFLTPEMIMSPTFAKFVPQFQKNFKPRANQWKSVPLLVIDEVHCLSDWGHDFRPKYRECIDYIRELKWGKKCTKIGTSATINLRVEEEMKKIFGEYNIVRGSLKRDIMIRTVDCGSTSLKRQWLLSWLKEEANLNKNILIFDFSVKNVLELTSFLNINGINATSYHAGVEPSSIKVEIESNFKTGILKIVVSTIALGMGFDKPDIDAVIHMYTPSSPLAYYQEIGMRLFFISRYLPLFLNN